MMYRYRITELTVDSAFPLGALAESESSDDAQTGQAGLSIDIDRRAPDAGSWELLHTASWGGGFVRFERSGEEYRLRVSDFGTLRFMPEQNRLLVKVLATIL